MILVQPPNGRPIYFSLFTREPLFVGDDACAHNLLLRGRPFMMRLQQLLPSPVIRSEWQIRGNFLTRAIARAAQVTTTTLSCCTNAELGEHTVCSSGLPCRHRSPSSMEYVRDE